MNGMRWVLTLWSGRPKPALDWYGSRVAIAGYGLLCLHIIGLSALALADPEAYRRAAWPETGWAEHLTVVWYACAGLLLFVVAARARGAPALTRGLYILGGITLLFFAGEEASYGQFWFNIPVPNLLSEVNDQQELNIHNIRGVEQSVLGVIFRQCRLALCVITVGALFCGRERLLGIPLPSMPLVLGILVVESIVDPPLVSVWQGISFHPGNISTILLALLAVYAVISGQIRALPAVVSAVVIATAAGYSMTPLRLAIAPTHLYEHQEYLYAAVCLWYAAELLLAQGRFNLLRLDLLARIPHRGLKLPTAISARRMGPAVCVLAIAVSMGWALFVYFGYERGDRYFEVIYDAPVAGRTPLARAAFDIYFSDGQLYYIREDCAEPNLDDTFFLHIYPVQRADLPAARQQHGFVNADFDFAGRGTMASWKCAVVIELPPYLIAQIHTGQYLPDGARSWAAVIKAPFTHLPAFTHSPFDIYIRGGQLNYSRADCVEQDLADKFFLHIYPAQLSDLRPALQHHGFENWDFDFIDRGGIVGARCVLSIALPDYPVGYIHTGQYTPDGGRSWEVEIEAPAAP